MTDEIELTPWEELRERIERGAAQPVADFLAQLGPAEMARAISRLSQADRSALLGLLDPSEAAELIEDVAEVQALDMIAELHPAQAAAIVEELSSDRRADLLGQLPSHESEAILDRMAPVEASDTRQLLAYPADSAGGLMITETLAYRVDQTVAHVRQDLEHNRERYAGYDVQYLYVLGADDALVGVLRMRDLLFPSGEVRLDSLMIRSPISVRAELRVEELKQVFDEHHLFGVPVVDAAQRLLGVVLPGAVEEHLSKRAVRQVLGISGIIGGEELRTLPLAVRSGRRLSWLSINIVLNLIAASVIAAYQDTIAAVITLAVFLPIISDMSGCSGNQASAVSMRELALGLVKPHELARVLLKESGVGILNGLALGVLLGGVAYLWKGNAWLGLVVGGALAVNTLLSVSLGGMLPLLLKRLGLDPALVSGPMLTTATDMCGFFLLLSFATTVLPRLV
jgi:magnesium transporter